MLVCVQHDIFGGINVLHMLETVANNVIDSIHAPIDYISGNNMKIENITIPGDRPGRTMIRL